MEKGWHYCRERRLRVCADHFERSCFMNPDRRPCRLVWDAVPTRFKEREKMTANAVNKRTLRSRRVQAPPPSLPEKVTTHRMKHDESNINHDERVAARKRLLHSRLASRLDHAYDCLDAAVVAKRYRDLCDEHLVCQGRNAELAARLEEATRIAEGLRAEVEGLRRDDLKEKPSSRTNATPRKVRGTQTRSRDVYKTPAEFSDDDVSDFPDYAVETKGLKKRRKEKTVIRHTFSETIERTKKLDPSLKYLNCETVDIDLVQSHLANSPEEDESGDSVSVPVEEMPEDRQGSVRFVVGNSEIHLPKLDWVVRHEVIEI